MLQKCEKKCVDKGNVFGALLTDLSKTFDFLHHELLAAKLNSYNFNLAALRLIHDYLWNRKQRIKNENAYTTSMEIIFGAPRGSILGPLLFNIYLVDLSFIINDIDIAKYTDDNIPYNIADKANDLIEPLEEASTVLFQWFDNNLLKSNPDK